MRTIALASGKGGSGKTTTTTSLAGAAVERGQRVLVIDLDPELHATYWLTGDAEGDAQLWEVFDGALVGLEPTGECAAAPAIEVVKGSPRLARIDQLLAEDPTGIPRALHRAMVAPRSQLDRYDLVLVDTPPNVGILPIAAVAGAGEVVVPVQPSNLDQRGLVKIRALVDNVARDLRDDARIVGVVPTRVKTGTKLGAAALARLTSALGATVTAPVRDAVDIADAPGHHEPITVFAPGAPVADDYRHVMAYLEAEELSHAQG